jgi:glucosamine 6-phosphate synthetase-like amidotransferase/phosphosugar isomerase protein
MAGFAFSSLTLSLKRAIVVAISHSGQTFPTLHATHALRKVCPRSSVVGDCTRS